jgi:CobQ-like glutamine amidotransferase family enzyme
MLTICGVYQLFGHFFQIDDTQKLSGISIFDAETIASPNRHIGNVVVDSEFGQLVGFENHSGETFLADGQASFAKVIKGTGNNEASGEEGARSKNTFGSYMHGPLLPKNPVFADELLRLAGERKWGSMELEHIDDMFAQKAAEIASHRPR